MLIMTVIILINKITLSNNINDERIDSAILDTFRENPYTQSLSSH